MSEAKQPDFLSYAVVFVEEGVFLPKCGSRGFLIKWQDIRGVCTTAEDAEKDRIRIAFAGDLEITVKEGDWLYGRRSHGIPGRSETIGELCTRLMPLACGEAEKLPLDENIPIDSIPTEELEKQIAQLDRALFVNAAIDELHTAISFVPLLEGDPRIVIDPTRIIEDFQFVLGIADPTTVLRLANAIVEEVENPQRRFSILRLITDDTYAYAGRIAEFTTHFSELITPKYIAKKSLRDALKRDIKRVNAAVERFFALVEPLDLMEATHSRIKPE